MIRESRRELPGELAIIGVHGQVSIRDHFQCGGFPRRRCCTAFQPVQGYFEILQGLVHSSRPARTISRFRSTLTLSRSMSDRSTAVPLTQEQGLSMARF